MDCLFKSKNFQLFYLGSFESKLVVITNNIAAGQLCQAEIKVK
jgi:hypothetical protein